jgi:hypothetical protein
MSRITRRKKEKRREDNEMTVETTEPRRRKNMWRVVLSVSALLAVHWLSPAVGQERYEPSAALSASRILPPELLSGPNHRVQEGVKNDGIVNIYSIDSRFGSFTAVSTAMLRIRIQEINAMDRMDKLKGTKEYGDSLKASGLDTLVAAKNMIFQPVKTTKEAVSGVGLMFRRAGDSLFGAKRSDAEDSRFKTLIGFSNYKRDYAHQLGVDVYSRNQVLQDRLNEVAWTGFAGGMTVSVAMAAVPGGAGVAMTAISTTRLTTAIFQTTPPQDLRRMNTEKLKAMGIDEHTIDTFISDSVFSPREQTMLVSALDEMKGVAERDRLVQLAALTDKADVAYFRQRQMEMYAGYHRAVSPIERFIGVGPVPAARTVKGALVFNIPVDYVVWTEDVARVVTTADNLANQLPGISEKQIWVTGTLSPRARAAMQRLNWKIYERNEALIVATDKQPTYQREDSRTPAATLKLKSKSVALGAGVSWGEGTLTFQGKDYPFSVSELSLLDLGASSVTGTGKVYNLKNVADFSGNYAATQATFAVAGGTGELTMTNAKGVVISLSSQESGTQLTAGPSGITLKLK